MEAELNFAEVEVGRTGMKTIEITNQTCEYQIYQVQRDPATNPLDHVFHLRSYTWALAPSEVFIFEIRYRPFVSFARNTDYFIVTDTTGTTLKIIVRGTSIGPNVVSSTTKVTMYCDTVNTLVKKRIKLSNRSKATGIFMFDIDDYYSVFTVQPKNGIIGSKGYELVTISFVPPEEGKYSYFLPCLILNQDPIIINLYGYCGDINFAKGDSFRVDCPWNIENGFEGYMTDNSYTRSTIPPISLSRRYFVFPHVDLNANDSIPTIPQAICLTNLSKRSAIIKWDTEKNGIFDVSPSSACVRADKSTLFEIRFYPNAENAFFSREIVASVFIEDQSDTIQDSFMFPFVTSIRAIGDSFPTLSNGWIPQYDIPKTVVMPPCTPSHLAYTTFLIKRFGHLPLMFRFVPPAVTRFTVKPLLGVIHSDYQIIALEMSAKSENEQIYVERWAIQLNGNEKNEICIDFKGYAEHANLSFNDNNLVNLAPSYPDCEEIEPLEMRNITRHTIKYEFLDVPEELFMQFTTGIIHSNDILMQELRFSSNTVADHDFNIRCIITPIVKDIPLETENTVNLRILAKSEYGSLLAAPSELNFGVQEIGAKRTQNFHVFNMSTVSIYYKIICEHRNWPVGNIEQDVLIEPIIGTVVSGGYQEINVSITPRTPGHYQLGIKYLIRKNPYIDNHVPRHGAQNICEINCSCILPTFRVKNMCCFSTCSHASKFLLWKAMQIDRFNDILKNILPGAKESFHLNFVPMLLSKHSIFIRLVLNNPTSLLVTWSFRRIKNCDCPQTLKKQRSLNCQKRVPCAHEKLCSISPETGTLQPCGECTISIEISATVLGESDVLWDLEILPNRHIILNMSIKCVTSEDNFLYFPQGSVLDFGPIYIGNKEATCRVHWLSNISNSNLPFSINIDPICELNRRSNCEVFSCKMESGIIEPASSIPIIFKFQPRSFETYKVTLPVELGDKEAELTLVGEATCAPLTPLVDFMPTYCKTNSSDFPVLFSADSIDTNSFATHSYVVRMLIVRNNLTNDTLSYKWHSVNVPDILKIEIEPSRGKIQAETIQSFHIKIRSEGQPCKINVDVACEFLNVSQRREYQRSVIKHDILSQELKDQFVITEKGVYVPKPWLKVIEEPKPFYKVVTMKCIISNEEDFNLSMRQFRKEIHPRRPEITIEKLQDKIIMKDRTEVSICTFILEGLLWDIVHSNWFNYMLREKLIKRNIEYSQFIMDPWEREKDIKRAKISPPWAFINEILETMLFIFLHEEFSLETYHFAAKGDIRNTNFLQLTNRIRRLTDNRSSLLKTGTIDRYGDNAELTNTLKSESLTVTFANEIE